MAGPFDEPPYPQLALQAFGPSKQHRVETHHGGRTIVIGDHTDLGFQKTHTFIQPGPDAVDLVIHGLPGRFIDQLGGRIEVPVALVAQLIAAAGVQRGVPLRLLTCHAGEAPRKGLCAAQLLATEWGSVVSGANGLLRIGRGTMRIDLVDWDSDPLLGGMLPTNLRHGQGHWIGHNP